MVRRRNVACGRSRVKRQEKGIKRERGRGGGRDESEVSNDEAVGTQIGNPHLVLCVCRRKISQSAESVRCGGGPEAHTNAHTYIDTAPRTAKRQTQKIYGCFCVCACACACVCAREREKRDITDQQTQIGARTQEAGVKAAYTLLLQRHHTHARQKQTKKGG